MREGGKGTFHRFFFRFGDGLRECRREGFGEVG